VAVVRVDELVGNLVRSGIACAATSQHHYTLDGLPTPACASVQECPQTADEILVSDAPPLTADEIQPGFRWERGTNFRDDPDLTDLYAQLLETGVAHIDENPYLQHQEGTVAALTRRAAEDGFGRPKSVRSPVVGAARRATEKRDCGPQD